MPNSSEKPFKIVLVGGRQVGKSRIAFWLREALGLNYIAQSPPDKHEAFDVYQNSNYTLFDTKKVAQYALGRRYYKNASLLLACFNANKPKTIDALRVPVQEIYDHSESPIIILINNQRMHHLNHSLQEKSAKKLNEFINNNGLDENNIYIVNAATGDNFEPLIDKISQLMLNYRLIKARLEKYITRIESHTEKNAPDKINFAYGFHFFKSIRAKNREANYRLAKELLKKLNKGEKAETLLPQASTIRKTYAPHWFFNHGIQSKELKAIIQRKPKPSR